MGWSNAYIFLVFEKFSSNIDKSGRRAGMSKTRGKKKRRRIISINIMAKEGQKVKITNQYFSRL